MHAQCDRAFLFQVKTDPQVEREGGFRWRGRVLYYGCREWRILLPGITDVQERVRCSANVHDRVLHEIVDLELLQLSIVLAMYGHFKCKGGVAALNRSPSARRFFLMLKDIEGAFGSSQGKMLNMQLCDFMGETFRSGKVVRNTRQFGYLCGTPERF
mgnify:CR=1 FL=1